MDFRLNDDQISLQAAARDFLSKECASEVVREALESPNGDAPDLYKKMAELGWPALAVPEEHGGLGLGAVEQAVLLEQLGYVHAPGGFFSTTGLAIPALLATGAHDLLPPLLEGGERATVAIDPDFVIDGQLADGFVMIEGEKVLWVTRQEAKVTPHETIDGTRRTASVSVPKGAGRQIGEASALEPVIDTATALVCAESVGGMQKVLDSTVEYVKARTQFGRVIGSFQVVKHRLADMLIRVEAARSAAYYSAWANGAGAEDAALAASVAKAYVSDAHLWVAGEGIQLHGGIGYTWEHDSHIWFKRATMNAALLGDAEFHRDRALWLVDKEAKRN